MQERDVPSNAQRHHGMPERKSIKPEERPIAQGAQSHTEESMQSVVGVESVSNSEPGLHRAR